MKQFFNFLFASCLGTLLALGVVALIGMGMIGNLVKSANKEEGVKANTVLTIKLNQFVPEKTNNTPVSPVDFKSDEIVGLMDMIEAINTAKTDDNIKGILIESPAPSLRYASLGSFRAALEDFKESGKFILAYADYYTEMGVYLASIADKVYLNPVGGVEFNGFAAQIPFYKDMLDKAGVKFEVFYAGKFKSATEPYRTNKMSDENRLQVREYLSDIYDDFIDGVAEGRSISAAELRKIANEHLVKEARDAVTYKLVDTLGYRDQLIDDLKERLGLDEKAKIQSMSLSKYTSLSKPKSKYKTKEKIAVVYAEGTIVMGKGEVGEIGGEKYAKIIRKIRKDKKVKAIVLRVNSGGGSSLASEKIWRELSLAREAGTPVIVSMGDYAASGGYYIACMADTIIAEPTTLTGSIGVFAMLPNTQKLMNDKVGIRVDTVKTGAYAVGYNPLIEMSPQEKAIVQAGVDEVYQTFLQRVADGRKMKKDSVNAIAQGRVWTGRRAVDNGLVDALGGLDDAMQIAAKMAGVEEYRVTEYPKVKTPIEQFIEELTGDKSNVRQALIKEEMGDYYAFYKRLKDIQSLSGTQARLPFEITIQ